MLSLLCAAILLSAPPQRPHRAGGDPLEEAYRALLGGDMERALTLAARSRPCERKDLLEARVALAAGRLTQARDMLRPFLKHSSSVAWPLPALWDAEAAIRQGAGAGVAKTLKRIFRAFRSVDPIAQYALHLRVMAQAWGEVPDEPCGLVPGADIGAAVLTRLGFSPQTPSEGGNQRSRYTSFLRERLPRAPFLTLADSNRRPIESSRTGYIAVTFVRADSPLLTEVLTKHILPITLQAPPSRKVTFVVIIFAQNRAAFTQCARRIRTLDRRGETLLLWTPRASSLVAYAVTHPPFLLLIPQEYESGICDWESPWGIPAAFFYRLRNRLRL